MGDSSQVAGYSNSSVPSDRPQGPAASTAVDSNAVGAGLVGAGGAVKALAQARAGRVNRRIAKFNAKQAETQADQAEQAGHFAANRVAEQERLVSGADIAVQAANNTVVGAGTNRLVTASNEAASAMDRLMIETNARREAYGYRVNAAGDRFAGKMAQRAGDNAAIATLLNTGAKEWMMSDANGDAHRGHGITFD